MSKFLHQFLVVLMSLMTSVTFAQQVPNSDFEDWSAAAFDGNPQAQGWNASNVEQVGMKFNFAHRESGHKGNYSFMVQDQSVGAMGITETSPGYFSLGVPWAYLPSITAINQATAGTEGGISWTHRPDTMSVWIKRTGSNWDKEDFYLLYYSWSGTAKGSKYKGKNGSCTSTSRTNEESDVRQAVNGNECGTDTKVTQVAEGMWRERKQYGSWTNIKVPIYYMNNTAPTMMNIIFSASNYPNFRANDGLYEGNSLYVDDLELIYSAAIQKIYIDGVEWKGFDPNSSAVQNYPLGENATAVPSIEAIRGAGSITNARGDVAKFPGRTLSGSEITITNGDLSSTPTTIVVKSGDGKSTKTYKIQFQKAASSNTKLAGIHYIYKDKNGNNVIANIDDFSPTKTNYNVELPYGTTAAPILADSLIDKQEEKQKIALTQATSTTGTATIVVTAPNNQATATYTIKFSIGKLADNTLKGITVNGTEIPGFTPGQTVYKVSLPVGTTKVPEIKAISEYPAGAQTIEYVLPTAENLDGGQAQIKVTTPGNTTARIYKLNFKLEASSYAYLKDLKVGNYITNFEPEKLTYYVNLPLGTTSLPTIIAVKGDEYQAEPEISSLGEGVVDGTVRITTTAGNGDQVVYKIVFSTEKSDNSSLKAILINGTPIPGFNPNVTAYVYALPVGTTEMPTITWIEGDEYQTITLTTAGLNGKSRLMVTAGDGSTTIYQITFSVQTYTDNTLKALYVGGKLIDGFESEKDEYWVNLEQGTTELPAVTYELQNEEFQSATARGFNGLNGDYKITVRPQSGASRTYIIHFSVATSNNVKLKMLYIDGVPVEGFDPEILNYVDSLPEGVSTIPAVTFEKDEETQRVLSILENRIQTITVTAESGAKREYTITFVLRVSKNAFLNNIFVDGVELEGFRKDSLTYTYQMTTERCPEITVDKAPGQQVTITAPYGAGIATIKVKPEEGEANTYTIEFIPTAAVSVRLQGILVNGVALEDFEPTTMHYTAEFEKTLPEVTPVKDHESQSVQVLWKGNVAWLHVSDADGNKAAYSVTFIQKKLGISSLQGIYADGQLIDGFAATTLDYSYELEPGSTYPEITYQIDDETEVVFFGQLAEGKWGIIVVAEDGTKAEYTVTYTIKAYNDVTLANLEVEGFDIQYAPETTVYGTFVIDEGVTLPQIKATPRKGQSVMIFNENDSTQHVLVMAESGAENTYIINYSRVRSDNVNLANIYVGGEPLFGFTSEVRNYTYTLPRDAKTVPSINAIPALDNQTVTTYFSRPDGVTKIEVVSQKGTKGEYTIAFPVEKSDNTLLKKLVINNETCDVNVTDYHFEVPFGTTDPYLVQYEQEPGQLIHFIDAPITGTTKIIVTNEKGNNSRTYTINYTIAEPVGENKVTKVNYSYVNAAGETIQGEKALNPGENIVDLPFGCTSFDVEEPAKSYPEQAIIFYNGGIRRGAKIIAVANRAGEKDVVYTIKPVMPEFETAGKLKELRFNGELVPNWRPDVYNYMINVTAQPSATNFTYQTYESDKTVTVSTFNAKTKQVTFTVDGGETYSVCWFYQNDDPQFDFTKNWVPAAKGPGYKPTSAWKVPADYADKLEYNIDFIVHVNLIYATGKEVIKAGVNGALLSTLRGAPMNGSVPGMMTTGNMSLSLATSGGSTSSMSIDKSTGVQFRNTPEQFTLDYTPLTSTNITSWYYDILLTDGTNTKTTHYAGNYNNLNMSNPATKTLDYTGLGAISRMSFAINSAHTANANDLGTGATGQAMYESQLLIQDLHFIYNSELTAATVNGKSTTKSGNTFTYTLDQNEVITGTPALKFTKKVQDQMQTIEWLDNAEWVNGKLRAKVINYGENSLDNTEYIVELVRPAAESVGFTANFGSFPTTKSNDTLFVNLPYGMKTIPSLTITPDNVHQLVSITKESNAVTVNVKAETGADTTVVYVFREVKSSDVELEGEYAPFFEAEIAELNHKEVDIVPVDVDNFIYKVVTTNMPVIKYEKKQGQAVDINYTKDLITLIVTAADGKTKRTYFIHRENPSVTTSGQIEEFYKGTNLWPELGNDDYEAEENRPTELISFVRKNETDSVVYIQTPTKMEWQVYGSQNHTYVLTYPTSASSNAKLADILIGGVHLTDFSEQDFEYIIESDTMLILTLVESELAQTIQTTQTVADETIVVYTTTVTAENQATVSTYTITVKRPQSDNALLAGIMLNSEMIANFNPTNFNYEVELPAPAVKKVQPKMPSISFLAGHAGQRITIKPGELNGDPTELFVQSEAGDDNTYTITVNAAPSACADLTGITINGEAVDQFEPGRHYYSQSLKTSQVEIDWTTDDRFQNITLEKQTIHEDHEYRYTLHVSAEDGIHTAKYEVMIYVENQSNDAQLANITLNGKNFDDFERALNEDLVFDGGNNNYIIYLPAGTTILPEVSAQLKMDGQQVEIIQKKDSILLDVKAVDGTPNQYVLKFIVPLSKNADLSMIYLDGDSLPGFEPNYYFYQVNLPVGVHTMPEVAAQKGENSQKIVAIEMDNDKFQATIIVQAEDPKTRENTYVVVFHTTQSDADKLDMIYQDGQPLDGFRPDSMYYAKSLPVGTIAFPDLAWQEADDFQTIHMDTVDMTADMLIRQIIVAAESGKKSTYTVSYTIEKSTIDTLQAIFINQKQLTEFEARKEEYRYILTAQEAADLDGKLPTVEYISGDEYQTVLVSQALDSLESKSLGYKTLITVTAASGKTRTYVIHYPVEKSGDAALNMIMLSGKPIVGFDEERLAYRLEVEYGADLPLVSVVKKEDAQVCDIRFSGDSIYVDVTAENGFKQTYSLFFERRLSANAKLADIIINGHDDVRFRPDEYDYLFRLPYGEDTIPTITWVLQDSMQTVPDGLQLDTLETGHVVAQITVIAPNGEDEASYIITFQFEKNNDNKLLALYIDTTLVAGFDSRLTEYEYNHPFGADSTAFFGIDRIHYVLSDTLAQDTIYADEHGAIFIAVTAQNGAENIYSITQTIGFDNDNALSAILLDGDTIRGFDPEILGYTYFVPEGSMPPELEAFARSANADDPIWRDVQAGDTCFITVRAQDKSERKYFVHFAISTLNTALEPTADDVLIKRIPGTFQIFVGTLRAGVTFALFDQFGNPFFREPMAIAPADVNDADIIIDADQRERLNDIYNSRSGVLIDLVPDQIYIYGFYCNSNKTSLKSGKLKITK
ncbi:MAG: hypothetical protein IKX20_10120 [Paludibacteraceae bacterium]|nr:hypothetical protein [Paludibacteraceae bacterium]